jgi:hypothetical protein
MRFTSRSIPVAAAMILILFATGCTGFVARDRVDSAGRRLAEHPGPVEAKDDAWTEANERSFAAMAEAQRFMEQAALFNQIAIQASVEATTQAMQMAFTPAP